MVGNSNLKYKQTLRWQLHQLIIKKLQKKCQQSRALNVDTVNAFEVWASMRQSVNRILAINVQQCLSYGVITFLCALDFFHSLGKLVKRPSFGPQQTKQRAIVPAGWSHHVLHGGIIPVHLIVRVAIQYGSLNVRVETRMSPKRVKKYQLAPVWTDGNPMFSRAFWVVGVEDTHTHWSLNKVLNKGISRVNTSQHFASINVSRKNL